MNHTLIVQGVAFALAVVVLGLIIMRRRSKKA
jgi:hypothetical protein